MYSSSILSVFFSKEELITIFLLYVAAGIKLFALEWFWGFYLGYTVPNICWFQNWLLELVFRYSLVYCFSIQIYQALLICAIYND